MHPQYGLVHALHCAARLRRQPRRDPRPAVGFAIVLVAALSMYLDLNARFYLLRRLFFRRASQNVVSPGQRPDAPARLFICAHYDAAAIGRRLPARSESRGPRGWPSASRFPIGPFRVLFWSLAILLPILGARMAGVDSGLISLLQLDPHPDPARRRLPARRHRALRRRPRRQRQRLRASPPRSRSPRSSSANPPENLDVWVLLTGGEECQQEGMRAFVRAHRKELDRESTYFVNLDAVGRGNVRYETGEGLAVSYDMDDAWSSSATRSRPPTARTATATGASRSRTGFAGDALPPRIAGFRATTITCLDDG